MAPIFLEALLYFADGLSLEEVVSMYQDSKQCLPSMEHSGGMWLIISITRRLSGSFVNHFRQSSSVNGGKSFITISKTAALNRYLTKYCFKTIKISQRYYLWQVRGGIIVEIPFVKTLSKLLCVEN